MCLIWLGKGTGKNVQRWEQRPGYCSGCEYGVLDGKIYSLGGFGQLSSNSCGSNKVYDLMENTWSLIMPMRYLLFNHDVKVVGDELYVFGGQGFDNFLIRMGFQLQCSPRSI